MAEKKTIEFWKEMIRIKLLKIWDVVIRKGKEFLCKGEEKLSNDQENPTNL